MSANPDMQTLMNRYGIVGRNEALREALATAVLVAPTDLSVLIQGESGVGKEVIPRIIHDHSKRKGKTYIAINCGSIPEGTIDSELFGHEKGAFTSAIGEHEGYFGAANGGTLFLDEVGELPMSTQARLLRVLETGEYMRVGSSMPRKTDVRIVAATNVDIPNAIKQGRFREDLYYRLCTINIKIPPLRKRQGDAVLLFKKFALDTAARYNIPEPIRLTPEAEAVVNSYKWPGNIRQNSASFPKAGTSPPKCLPSTASRRTPMQIPASPPSEEAPQVRSMTTNRKSRYSLMPSSNSAPKFRN